MSPKLRRSLALASATLSSLMVFAATLGAGLGQRCTPFTDGTPRDRLPAAVHRCRRNVRVPCRAAADGEKGQTPSWQEAMRACLLSLAAAASISTPLAFAPEQLMPPAEAVLPLSDPVKNARSLLRYALPVSNKPARQIQVELEGISEDMRIPGSKALGPISRAVRKAHSLLGNNKKDILAAFAPAKAEAGRAAVDKLDRVLTTFETVVEGKDKNEIPGYQQEALGYVGQIEEAMVKGFPYEVPQQYAHLPQLKGRATVDMEVRLKEARLEGVQGGTLRIVVDGYNAPVTSGNFVDLVKRGFYNGMDIQRADGFVVQTGNPGPPAEGFVDKATGQVRRIPFEVMVKGDKAPTYEETLEDLGRFNEQPTLPFNAFGTMALARGEFETNSGSSQVFWLLKESELTPSGSNLLDARYAVFGYVVEGQDLLQQMQVGDKIVSATIVDGAEYLQEPKAA